MRARLRAWLASNERDVLVGCGVLLVSAGAALFSVRAGLITLGGALLYLGLWHAAVLDRMRR